MKHLQVNKAQTFSKREENKEIKTTMLFFTAKINPCVYKWYYFN